jgi:ribonuclease HI
MRKEDLRLELERRDINCKGTTKRQYKTALLNALTSTATRNISTASIIDTKIHKKKTIKVNRKEATPNTKRRTEATHHSRGFLTSSVAAPDVAEQTPLSEAKRRANPLRTYVLTFKGVPDKKSNGTGVGIVLRDPADDNVMWTVRKYLRGSRTHYEAEYTALVLALRYAKNLGVQKLIVYTDKDVMLHHLNGKYPVEKKTLIPMYWQVMHLKDEFEFFSLELILRQQEKDKSEDIAEKTLATGVSFHVDDEDESESSPLFNDPMGEGYAGPAGDGPELVEETLVVRAAAAREKTEMEAKDPRSSLHLHRTIDPSKTYLLKFDGGVRGNPDGISGAGMVLYDEFGKEVWCGWKYLGMSVTNNVAEYRALIMGLRQAKSLGIERLRCQGDSELIVKQMKGEYRVRNPGLQVLYAEAKDLMESFENCELSHIMRKENKRADWLANIAMDKKDSYGLDD